VRNLISILNCNLSSFFFNIADVQLVLPHGFPPYMWRGFHIESCIVPSFVVYIQRWIQRGVTRHPSKKKCAAKIEK